MLRRDEISAVILAGGRATRLGGIDKRSIVVEGEPIFVRQTRVLAPLVTEILVSAPHDAEGYRTVRDVAGAVGPLAGIAAALGAVRTPWLFVAAGDMPNISAPLVSLMIEHASGDAVGVRIGGRSEPLVCLLRVTPARTAIGELLAAARFKASGLLDALAVTWLSEAAVRAIDPSLKSLRNINTPADL